MAVTTPTRGALSGADRIRPRVPPLLARFSTQRPHRRMAGYAVAILGTVALTLSFLPVRSDITPLSKGFGFLAVVVVAAAVGGLGPGILASLLGFLAFNFFFIPPYGTFVIVRAEDVVVLFVFLGLSILISALLARATERAASAEAREAELRTLQTLSAELVALVPGPGSGHKAEQAEQPRQDGLREQVTVGAAPG